MFAALLPPNSGGNSGFQLGALSSARDKTTGTIPLLSEIPLQDRGGGGKRVGFGIILKRCKPDFQSHSFILQSFFR